MKKKILFVINTLGRAGAETAMLALINKLNPQEYDISLYVMLNQGELVHELPSYVRLLNKNFCDVSVLSKEGKRKLYRCIFKKLFSHGSVFKNFFYMLSNAVSIIKNGGRLMADKLLWRAVSDGSERFKTEYDAAVAYIEGASAYYVHDHVKAAKKCGFIHIDYGQAGYTRALDKDCYLDFDRIFAVSDEVRHSFLSVYKNLGEKTKVFHNIVDEEKILKKAEESISEMKADGAAKLLTVGRLTYQKGFDVAVKALKILIGRGYEVHWYVVGDGPEYDALIAQAEREKVSEYFHLLGAKNNPYPYYRKADIYVHATRFEGKSIALTEAQILGCAIVASDCSGNREQIDSGENGILCEFSPEDIADAVENLILNPKLAEKFAQAAAKRKINHLEELQYIYELMR